MATIDDVDNTPQSGMIHIDALIDQGPDWSLVTPGRNEMFYTFSTASATEPGHNPAAFNAAQEAATEAALAHLSVITGITFTETANGANADLHFGSENLPGPSTTGFCSWATSYAFDGDGTLTFYSADAWIYLDNAEWLEDNESPAQGTNGYETLLHEIGHAFGLKHPFDDSPNLPDAQDNTSNTVMSYTHDGGPYSTFRQYDIAALNYLYGRDGLGGEWGQGTTGEYLTGTLGDDSITPGSDFTFHAIEGADGSDRVIYQGNSGNFTITPDGEDWLHVVGGNFDDFVSRDVETLQFTNGSFTTESFFSGTTFLWSALTDNQVINSFSPATDVLRFNDAAISAAAVSVTAGSVIFDHAGKTVTLDMDLAAVTTTNITFQNGTLLLVGDNTTGVASDNSPNTLTGGTGNDQLIGLGGSDTLVGGSGNDVLAGGTGNDSLDGGSGVDQMSGGTGNDTYVVSNSSDVVAESANQGTDHVRSSGSHTLAANVERLTLTGSAGTGTGNNLNNVITGNSAVNTLSGGSGNDSLDGGSSNDILSGGSGNDTLNGGTGPDQMSGGTGNDVYIVDSSTDVANESASAGTDTVQSRVSHTLGANVENLVLTENATNGTGNTLANALTGNTRNNTLSGDAGNDSLDGGTGNDALNGGAGNDTLNGGLGIDRMSGGAGNDIYIANNSSDIATENASSGTDHVQAGGASYTLGANVERLTLTGSAGNGTGNSLNNVLTGNGVANQLTGGSGNDTLAGGLGNDTLAGGTGNDRFLFDTALNGATNVDRISDFNPVADALRLDDVVFIGLPLGTLASSAFRSGTQAQDSTDRIIYNPGTGAVLFDSDGTGAAAAVRFATLDPGLAITNSDFIVV